MAVARIPPLILILWLYNFLKSFRDVNLQRKTKILIPNLRAFGRFGFIKSFPQCFEMSKFSNFVCSRWYLNFLAVLTLIYLQLYEYFIRVFCQCVPKDFKK